MSIQRPAKTSHATGDDLERRPTSAAVRVGSRRVPQRIGSAHLPGDPGAQSRRSTGEDTQPITILLAGSAAITGRDLRQEGARVGVTTAYACSRGRMMKLRWWRRSPPSVGVGSRVKWAVILAWRDNVDMKAAISVVAQGTARRADAARGADDPRNGAAMWRKLRWDTRARAVDGHRRSGNLLCEIGHCDPERFTTTRTCGSPSSPGFALRPDTLVSTDQPSSLKPLQTGRAIRSHSLDPSRTCGHRATVATETRGAFRPVTGRFSFSFHAFFATSSSSLSKQGFNAYGQLAYPNSGSVING